MKGENQNLFGEGDVVFNALETELTVVTSEIDSAQKSINRLKEKILDLEERRTELKKSVEIVGGFRKKKEAPKEKKKEEKDVTEQGGTAAQDPY